MPGNNGTGPLGYGPGTGWGMGPCGCGLRQGHGRWFRHRRFYSTKNELAALTDEEEILKAELAAIREEKAALTKKDDK